MKDVERQQVETGGIDRTSKGPTALQRSQHLSEVALESGDFGSWSLDLATQRATRSFRHDEIFGYTQPADDWSYEAFIGFVDPRDRDQVDLAYRSALERGDDWEFNCRINRLDGEERWIWAKGKHFRNPEGTPIEIVGIVSDITNRKRVELAMRQNEKLAAVGRLASTIAHEMNNPLEAVTNLLYLAEHTDNSAEVKDYIKTAQSELQRVAAIANQTLKFQRAVPVVMRVSAQQLLESARIIFHGRYINHVITVEERHRSTATVLCFDGELRQVLNNFINNALDAMKPGGKLFLRSRDVAASESQRAGIVITIADTGAGMSADVAKRIYEPFFSTKGASGSGLGLWVSQEIICRHHGRLTMRSSHDPLHHGTVFALYLPSDLKPDQQIMQ